MNNQKKKHCKIIAAGHGKAVVARFLSAIFASIWLVSQILMLDTKYKKLLEY